jgi:hypothetical protein
MKLTVEQKNILVKIRAPHIEKDDLDEAELAELCDFITDYVVSEEMANDEVSAFGEELLSLHDDIII